MFKIDSGEDNDLPKKSLKKPTKSKSKSRSKSRKANDSDVDMEDSLSPPRQVKFSNDVVVNSQKVASSHHSKNKNEDSFNSMRESDH